MGVVKPGDRVKDCAPAPAWRSDEEEPDGVAVEPVRGDGAEHGVDRAAVGQVEPAAERGACLLKGGRYFRGISPHNLRIRSASFARTPRRSLAAAGGVRVASAREGSLDRLRPVGAVAAAFVPLRAHEAGPAKEAVDAVRVVASPESEVRDERHVGGRMVFTVAGGVAVPEPLYLVAVLRCERSIDDLDRRRG